MLQKLDAKTLTPAVFSVFGENHALLTAGDRAECNTMTIGWCGLGRIWQLPACTVYVRPERYTYSFLERHEFFTVCVLPARCREILDFCGTHSGRDTDKVRACSLHVQYGAMDAPFFAEANWALVCKKRYAQDLTPDCVTDPRVLRSYQQEGWHRMYIGEVVEVYGKETI